MVSHNKLNLSYINKLRGMEKVLINHEYWNARHNRCVGELDGFAYRRCKNKNVAFIIETKSSYNNKLYYKALLQFTRAEKKFIPKYERHNNIHFDRIVYLFVTPNCIECAGVTYK